LALGRNHCTSPRSFTEFVNDTQTGTHSLDDHLQKIVSELQKQSEDSLITIYGSDWSSKVRFNTSSPSDHH